jgi:putative Holliday junction resolvase
MGRVLCIDYGERHTGVAVSDQTRSIAQGLSTVHHQTDAELIAALQRLVAEHEIAELVIGLPLGQTGRPSTRSNHVRAFASRLHKATGVPIVTVNERYSTARADAVLRGAYGGTSRKTGRRRNVNKVAATMLLQDYLGDQP